MDNWDFEWSGNIEKDIHTDNKTSRNVFSAFCDSLESRDDLLSGGSPQLVVLYRTGSAKTIGIIHDGKRYLNGLPVESSSLLNEIEWRNRLFERCDGKSMTLLKGAQKQPRPDTIKKPY